MLRHKTILVILISLLTSTLLLGDVIHFKDGRKIEGEIVSQDSKSVKVKTKFGTREILLSEIEKIEEKMTKDQEYESRVSKVDPRNVDDVLGLVNWCKENKLESKAKKHLNEIIKLDPNNEKAREMLGFVKYGGKWLTQKQKIEMEKEAERAEKIKQGLVEYKGEWVNKEDVEKMKQGLIKYEGEWVTEEEKNRLENNLVLYEGQWIPAEDVEKMEQGLFKVNDNWVKQEEADRLHSDWENPWELKLNKIRLITNKNYAYAQGMLLDADMAYDQIKKLVKVEPDLEDTLITVYVLATMDQYCAMGDEIGEEQSSSYNVFYVEDSPEDGPVSVTYSRSDPRKGDIPTYVTYTKGLVRHAVIQQYLTRIDERAEIPPWFIVGQGAKSDRFYSKDYISYYLKELRRVGGFIKTKQFFDAFGYTEQEIYTAGLLCAYLDDKELSDRIKKPYEKALESLSTKKKISFSFTELEKALSKDEKNIREFMDKH